VLFYVARLKTNSVVSPATVIIHNIKTCRLQPFLGLDGVLQPNLKSNESLLGSKDHEVAGLSISCEADVELVVFQFQGGVVLLGYAKQLIGHRDGLLRPPRFPVGSVGGFLSLLILINEAKRKQVNNSREDQSYLATGLKRSHLDGNERNHAIEQVDYVEEAACDVLRDDDGSVLVLWIPFALNVPVLDCTDNMAFIGCAELNLNFIPPA
jgi:hypothetical protein